MNDLTMLSPEAYQAENQIKKFGQDSIEFLKKAILKSNRNRSRICSHPSTDEELHEMFVIYGKDTYVRPNKHFGKDESIFVLEGSCDVCFFSDTGDIIKKISLGEEKSGLPYYCRIPKEIFHTVVINSEFLVLFEATSGPFDPLDTFYANWSPEETDFQGISRFREIISNHDRISDAQTEISDRYDFINEKVYFETEEISYLSATHGEFLKEKLNEGNLDRIRICNHVTPNEKLHEMLMLFSRDTFVTPSMHIDREESLLILDGEARYIFFDKDGSVTNVVPLSNNPLKGFYYCRVPKNTFHMLVVDSPYVLVKETATGPFDKSSTIFPNWVQNLSCKINENEFLEKIEKQIRNKNYA